MSFLTIILGDLKAIRQLERGIYENQNGSKRPYEK